MWDSPTVHSLFPLLPGRAYYSVQVPKFTDNCYCSDSFSISSFSHHRPLCVHEEDIVWGSQRCYRQGNRNELHWRTFLLSQLDTHLQWAIFIASFTFAKCKSIPFVHHFVLKWHSFCGSIGRQCKVAAGKEDAAKNRWRECVRLRNCCCFCWEPWTSSSSERTRKSCLSACTSSSIRSTTPLRLLQPSW